MRLRACFTPVVLLALAGPVVDTVPGQSDLYAQQDKMGNFDVQARSGTQMADDRMGNFIGKSVFFVSIVGPVQASLHLAVVTKSGRSSDRWTGGPLSVDSDGRYPISSWESEQWNARLPGAGTLVGHGAWSRAEEAWEDRNCARATHLVQMALRSSDGKYASQYFLCMAVRG